MRSIQADMTLNYDNIINEKNLYIEELESRVNLLLSQQVSQEQHQPDEVSVCDDLITLYQDYSIAGMIVPLDDPNKQQMQDDQERIQQLMHSLDEKERIIREQTCEIENIKNVYVECFECFEYKTKYASLLAGNYKMAPFYHLV
jgi:hypothetical protein